MRRVLGHSLSAHPHHLTATSAAAGHAQITGTVTDSSGGVLPGASVTATQTRLPDSSERAIADAAGLSLVPGIPIGPTSST